MNRNYGVLKGTHCPICYVRLTDQNRAVLLLQNTQTIMCRVCLANLSWALSEA